MPRTARKTSPPAMRRSNSKSRPKIDALRLQDEHDMTSERDERPLMGGPDEHTPGHKQGHTGERNDQSGGVEVTQSGSVQRTVDDGTRSDQPKQPKDRTNPATLTPTDKPTDTDVFAPVLAAWNQMLTPMMEFAGAVVQMQHKTFAAMIGAANTNAGHTRDDEQGNHIPGQINNDPGRSVSSTSTPRERVSSTSTASS